MSDVFNEMSKVTIKPVVNYTVLQIFLISSLNTMVKMLKPYAKIQRFIIAMLKQTAYLQCCYKKLYVRTLNFGTIYYFTNIKDASLYTSSCCAKKYHYFFIVML